MKIDLSKHVKGQAFDLGGDGTIGNVIIEKAKVTAFQDIAPYNSIGYSNTELPYAYKGHGGVDFQAPIGTPLRAYFDTNVISSGFEKTMGNYFITSDGFRFLHLREYPRTGIHKAGDIIAYSGDSGIPGQPHIHVDRKPNNIDILEAFKSGAMLSGEISGQAPTPAPQGKHPNAGNFRAVRPNGEVARFKDEYITRLQIQSNGMYRLNQDTPQCDTNNNTLPASENWLAGSVFHYIMNDEA